MVGTTIYHTNPALRSIIVAANRSQRRLRLVGLGGQLMAVDTRRLAAHPYRLWQDGLHHVAGLLAQRRVAVTREELRMLLKPPSEPGQLPSSGEPARAQMSEQQQADMPARAQLPQQQQADVSALAQLSQQQEHHADGLARPHPQLLLSRLGEPARAVLESLSYGQCIISCQLADSCRVSLVAFASRQKIELDINEEVRNYYLFLLGEEEQSDDSDNIAVPKSS